MSMFANFSSKEKKFLTLALILSLAAFVVTIFLVQAHFMPYETGAFCNLDDYWNCDIVNQSKWSTLFYVPVSIWGLLFYAGFAAVLAGCLANFNFEKLLKPLKIQTILLANTIVGVIVSIFLAYYEFVTLGPMGIVGLLKNVIAALGFIWIYNLIRKSSDYKANLIALLVNIAFFGVSFALYLTNIEFLLLRAVCVYCLAQQILILFILIILSITLSFSLKTDDRSKQS